MAKILDFEKHRQQRQCEHLQNGGAARKNFPRCRMGMPEFTEVRERIRDEAESLAPYYEEPRPERDAEFDLKIARASYAIYLLETVDRIMHAADRRGEPGLYASVKSAMNAVKGFLGGGYFEKSVQGILDSYVRMEGVLDSCARRFGIMLMMPEEAVEAAKMKFAQMIEDSLGRRSGGPRQK